MKKPILLLLLFATTLLSAQNWMPFNPNANKTHYKCDKTVQFKSRSSAKSFYPIQTINVTSRTIDSVKQILVFSKGVNINMLNKLFNSNWSSYYQPIKGKMFGDTAFFYADSTVVKTIDGNGFTLNFPNNYGTIGSYRTIGKNKKNNHFLKARLNTRSYDNTLQDSLVYLTLRVYDSLNNVIPHAFHQSQVIFSKNNGVVKTIDFTQLDSALFYQKTSTIPDTISNQLNNVLTTGDEYYFNEYYSVFIMPSPPPPFTGWRVFRRSIIADTTIGNTRTIQTRETRMGDPSGAPFHRIITDTFSINANYLISNSGIVNPNSQISSNAYNTISMYYSKDLIILGVIPDIGFASLVSYKSYDFLFNGTTDSLRRLQFEGGKQSLRIIGVGDDENDYASSTASSYDHDKNIVYIKKGNQTWGTKPFLFTGLETYSASKNNIVFPNPTTNQLNIKSSLKFEKIVIRDLSGRFVQEQNYNEQVDVSNLESGIYFLQLVGKNNTEVMKFVKATK